MSVCLLLPTPPPRETLMHPPVGLFLVGGWVENPPPSTEAAKLGAWEVLMSVGMPRSC